MGQYQMVQYMCKWSIRRRGEKDWGKKYLAEILAENLTRLMKYIDTLVQETVKLKQCKQIKPHLGTF